MHIYTLSILVLVQHATISLTAPVFSSINTSPLIPRQTQQNFTILQTNPILNTRPIVVSALIASHPNILVYPIPSSRTTLYIQLGAPIPSTGMASTLLLALIFVDKRMERFGDSQLTRHGDDPFNYNEGLGVQVSVGSCQGQYMTYGILRTTLRGIREFLYANHRYVGATFSVGERDVGIVGSGVIEARSRGAVETTFPLCI